MTNPDIFGNVHKGIRKALFDACLALGRAAGEQELAEARRLTRDALRFVEHHGRNEDELLLPLIQSRAPSAFSRMTAGHAAINPAVAAIASALEDAPAWQLYHQVCALTALYLEHMREEEQLRPMIEGCLTAEELTEFGRRAVERTSPDDQRMMLACMFSAMNRVEIDGFLARLPSEVAAELRRLTPS